MNDKFSLDNIEAWLVSYLSKALEEDESQIDVDASFDTYGLESSSIAAMTGDLADWLGQDIDPAIIYEYPTIASLAEQLATSVASDQ